LHLLAGTLKTESLNGTQVTPGRTWARVFHPWAEFNLLIQRTQQLLFQQKDIYVPTLHVTQMGSQWGREIMGYTSC
jgi:hypothetical protein